MTFKYLANDNVEWYHPHDNSPPLGTKLLLYFYPHGVTVIGEWQNSGASLWAALPKVRPELKERLEIEHINRQTTS